VPERLSMGPERLSMVPERLSMVPERLSMVPERMSMVPERLRETIRPSWSSCSDFLAFSAHRRLYARRFLIGSA